MKDEAVANLWLSGLKDRSALDELKQEQFDALIRAYLHVCDTMYFQAQVGAGDQESVESGKKVSRETLNKPPIMA